MKKTAIVTGGSRGLGAAMVQKLGALGYRVAINYHSDSSAGLAAELVEALTTMHGVDAIAVQADVGRYEDCQRLLQAATDRFGEKIDVLVNNAGITNNKNFIDITCAQYDRLMATNLMSAMHMCHLALPYMVDRETCIVNVSSVNGLTGAVNQADYCAAKAGLIGLTRGLALEFAGRKVRVNAIAPGLIQTDMIKGVNQEELKAAAAGIPQGYIGDPSDIAGCLEYIVCAPYLTGQTISPNGGFVMP